MHPQRIIVGALILLALPWSAFAMQSTTWDFTNGQIAGDWQVTGFDTTSPTPEGLHIQTTGEGRMVRDADLQHPAETVSFTFKSSKDIDAFLLTMDENTQDMLSMGFTIPAGEERVDLNMLDFERWNRHVGKIGFALPGGTDVILESIELSSWSFSEKLGEMWKSFWKFDQLLPYSINFLWGPILTRTSIATDALYTVLPPRGWAFNRILLPAIGIAGVVLFALWLLRMKRERTIFGIQWHWGMFFLVFGIGWLIFDLRMGLELLSYVKQDYQTYVFAPPENGTLRNYEAIYYGIFANMKTLREEPVYVLDDPPQTPFMALARYLTYPSLPIEQQNLVAGVRNWLIFERDDIEIGPTNQLMLGNRPLTPPGQIVARFGNHSLLFRTFAPLQ